MLERMDQVFRGVGKMTSEIPAPSPEKKWCEPTERTRTKELLDLLYRSVQPHVVVTVASLLARLFFRFGLFFRWARSRLRMGCCDRTGGRLR
ncbi:MAG: hypothetical protein WAL96_18180, partial [Candidatus Sulfotelmatobacter sp.]